jgi:hypothetical protein
VSGDRSEAAGADSPLEVNALADLDATGVAFVSTRDNLDISTPSEKLMFQVVRAMAEFERAQIRPSRPIQLHLDSILNQPMYNACPAIEHTATTLIASRIMRCSS